MRTILFRAFLSLAVIVALTVAYFVLSFLNPNMRGPRGYYVQQDDPATFIEFFKKPNARSNIVKKYGVAPFHFSAFDTDIDMYGPDNASKEEQRRYWISGEGAEIVILDMSAKPDEHGEYPKMEFKRVKR